METFLFWVVYLVAAASAGYHSFMVYRLSDPALIALGGAISIEGLCAYSMFAIKNWTGNQRLAGFIGVMMFAVLSGAAQIISRYHSLGVELPEWLLVVSMGLVPLSTVGAVLTLGIINFFRGSKSESPIDALQATVKSLSERYESFTRPPVAELTDADRAEMPLLTSFNSDIPEAAQKKRGPGRPPKSPKA